MIIQTYKGVKMKPLVLITGGGGYLGLPLVKHLIQSRNYNILMSFDNINETIDDGIKADIIIHLAAKLPSYKGDPNVIMETNFNATKKIVEQKSKSTTHFIFLSTDYVFESDGNKHFENSKRNPETIYGKSKALAEDYLLNESNIDVTILRTSMLYGYDNPKRSNFFKFLHQKMIREEEVKLFSDVFSRPTHVRDLVTFVEKVIEEKILGVFHCSANRYINRSDLGKLFCKANNFDENLIIETTMPPDGRWPTELDLNPSVIFLEHMKYPIHIGVKKCLTKF